MVQLYIIYTDLYSIKNVFIFCFYISYFQNRSQIFTCPTSNKYFNFWSYSSILTNFDEYSLNYDEYSLNYEYSTTSHKHANKIHHSNLIMNTNATK